MKSCLNCGHNKITRPRGLCWRCYYTPGVKERFDLRSPVGVGTQGKKSPCKPTTARPGSEEKLNILAERAANNQELFHELDP